METKVIIRNARLSYCHLLEPSSMNGDKPKYSVSLIIDKGNTDVLKAIETAIANVKTIGAAKWGGKVPGNLKIPVRDGDVDRPDDDAYQGCYFINANSTTRPQIIDRKKEPILDSEEVYSGMYANVSVNFYAYNFNGSKGIACGLNNVQKVKDGDFLGGKSNAQDEFDAMDDEEFSFI